MTACTFFSSSPKYPSAANARVPCHLTYVTGVSGRALPQSTWAAHAGHTQHSRSRQQIPRRVAEWNVLRTQCHTRREAQVRPVAPVVGRHIARVLRYAMP